MAENTSDPQAGWGHYYKVTAGRLPREFLVKTLRRFQAPGSAIDLGCGAGVESLYMLEQGWQVLAIDQQESAVQGLLSSVAPDLARNLNTLVIPFESLTVPPADLIWAGLSLPFCQPGQFDRLWASIGSALAPGGRFAGDFFGVRHAWAEERDMTFLTREEVLSLCLELELEYLVEEEGEQQTVSDGMRHWHMFTVCARKP